MQEVKPTEMIPGENYYIEMFGDYFKEDYHKSGKALGINFIGTKTWGQVRAEEDTVPMRFGLYPGVFNDTDILVEFEDVHGINPSTPLPKKQKTMWRKIKSKMSAVTRIRRKVVTETCTNEGICNFDYYAPEPWKDGPGGFKFYEVGLAEKNKNKRHLRDIIKNKNGKGLFAKQLRSLFENEEKESELKTKQKMYPNPHKDSIIRSKILEYLGAQKTGGRKTKRRKRRKKRKTKQRKRRKKRKTKQKKRRKKRKTKTRK